jgi:hypothetical protein
MNLSKILEELDFMQSHLFVHPEVAVERWTSRKCDDYHMALLGLLGFLASATPPIDRACKAISDRSENLAVVDILQNSSLASILKYDETERCIRYQDQITPDVKEQIALFLMSRMQGILN